MAAFSHFDYVAIRVIWINKWRIISFNPDPVDVLNDMI